MVARRCGGHGRLDAFLEEGAAGYAHGRDFPAKPHCSRMSPFLQSGNISSRELWAAIDRAEFLGLATTQDREKFRAELGWRDFAAHLMFHNEQMLDQEFQPKFRAFPWRHDAGDLKKWQSGMTGYPVVDAAMRELRQTGYMHNRMRMVTASFLVKHLRIDWRAGRDWFWDNLLDADIASNTASWQWVAGCGADAAPYFRVFNPMTQAKRFDPDGTYIRQYVPELSNLPDRFINAPWTAPSEVLRHAGVILDQTYPAPMIDHAAARNAALETFSTFKNNVQL